MRQSIIILAILIPLVCGADPFDSGNNDAQTDLPNTWPETQTFYYLVSDSILIPVNGKILFAGGNNSIYEISSTQLGVEIGGSWRCYFTSTGIVMSGGGTLRTAGSRPVPSFAVDNGDLNTGLSPAGDDSLGFVAGGVEGARVAEGGSGNNGILFSVYGDLAIDSSGVFTGNDNIRGSDSFDALAIADTILNANFDATDVFDLQFTGAVGDSIKTLFATAKEDTLIVNRAADGDAGQTYTWRMIK